MSTSAINRQRERALQGETPDLTLDEINDEIREVRRLRKEQKQKVQA